MWYLLCIAWTAWRMYQRAIPRDGDEERTLVRPARAHADVAHIARLDDVVESLHLSEKRQG